MGNTHPKASIQQALELTQILPVNRHSIARERVIGYNHACNTYGISHRHKPCITVVVPYVLARVKTHHTASKNLYNLS